MYIACCVMKRFGTSEKDGHFQVSSRIPSQPV